MKITIQHYDEEVSILMKRDDLTTTEVLDKLRGLLVACGYNESNIIDSFYELYEEHNFKLHPSKTSNLPKSKLKNNLNGVQLKSLLNNNNGIMPNF